MEIGPHQAPEVIGIAAAEKAQRLHLARVRRVFPLQGFDIHLEAIAVDEGPDETALVEQMDGVRWRIDGARIAGLQVIGRDHFRDQRSEEHTSELQSLMRLSYAVFCLNKQHHSR